MDMKTVDELREDIDDLEVRMESAERARHALTDVVAALLTAADLKDADFIARFLAALQDRESAYPIESPDYTEVMAVVRASVMR